MDCYQNTNKNLSEIDENSWPKKRQKIEHNNWTKVDSNHSHPMNLDIINVDGFPTSPEITDCGGTSSSSTAVQQNADNFIQFYNIDSGQQQPLNDYRLQQTSGHKTMDIFTDVRSLQPPEGRPILNTSLLKFAAQNQQQQQQQQQQKGRTPLTTVPNNNNIMVKHDGNVKKSNDITVEDDFFVFKLRPPQVLNEDFFSKLSDEMILSVFKWLPKKALMRCSNVCRRFYVVAQDESLWTRLDLAGKHLRSGAMDRILNRGVVIFRLAQSKIADPVFDIDDLPAPPECMSKLQYLDLSMAVVSKSALKAIFSRCRLLKKLSLEHVQVDDSICKELAENQSLEALNFTMCDGIDEQSIRTMMTNLKSLQSLNISWTSLSMDAVRAFVGTVPIGLTRLNIAGCRKTMTDSSLSILVNRCPNLIELDLSDCGVLTSDAIKILTKLTHLEYLSLSRCYGISVPSFLAINELISLAFLDIFGVLSDQALKAMKQSFPSVGINQFIYSAVARPTVGSRRTSIWGLRTRD